MNNSFTTKNKKNNETLIGKSILSTYDSSEIENRLTLLEAMLFKLSSQNEILMKRIEDLQNKQSQNIKNFNEFKSDDDEISIERKFLYKDSHFNFLEWKNDIEKSLEKISERVASNSTSTMMNLLEKRVNDFCNELIKLKKQFYEEVEINNKTKEKLEKTEKYSTNISSLFSEFKTNNIKWQNDCVNKLNILNEKIEIEENYSDLFKEFIKVSNVKFENFSVTIKNIINENKLNKEHFDNKYFERLKQIEEEIKNVTNQFNNLNKTVNEELKRYEVSNKALWDSLALFTSSLKSEC